VECKCVYSDYMDTPSERRSVSEQLVREQAATLLNVLAISPSDSSPCRASLPSGRVAPCRTLTQFSSHNQPSVQHDCLVFLYSHTMLSREASSRQRSRVETSALCGKGGAEATRLKRE
jgi:hypothetical protein